MGRYLCGGLGAPVDYSGMHIMIASHLRSFPYEAFDVSYGMETWWGRSHLVHPAQGDATRSHEVAGRVRYERWRSQRDGLHRDFHERTVGRRRTWSGRASTDRRSSCCVRTFVNDQTPAIAGRLRNGRPGPHSQPGTGARSASGPAETPEHWRTQDCKTKDRLNRAQRPLKFFRQEETSCVSAGRVACRDSGPARRAGPPSRHVREMAGPGRLPGQIQAVVEDRFGVDVREVRPRAVAVSYGDGPDGCDRVAVRHEDRPAAVARLD
jgi:hypothetical protein